ncbi:hypothetical protein [Dokdonella sp.]|uniref:hypothetical protein n=1 Tax=Dokdonella sp. TaxID=2291710 RepID=UPI001B1609EB|nr:hypothetical protein [Dokdonella sp.]MBO9664140.1 hypothetical protein [Dokdonella sp.]
MRTHLLRAVYPSVATSEPDTGCAANDASYAGDDTVAAKTRPSPVAPHARDEHDDYVLGGYAGI